LSKSNRDLLCCSYCLDLEGVTTGLAFQFLVFDVALEQAAPDSVALEAIE